MLHFHTDREYAAKRDETRQTVKIDGYKVTLVAKDFWEGPVEPGEAGHWMRGIFLERGA